MKTSDRTKFINGVTAAARRGEDVNVKNSAIEKTKKEIFKKYPNAVIYFVYDYGVLFYANEEQTGNEDNLHNGFIKDGALCDVTEF